MTKPKQGVARTAALEKFWKKVKDHFFDDWLMDLEYFDFQEWGADVGLLVSEIYDPNIHGEISDIDPGDLVWFDPDDPPRKVRENQ